VQLPVAGEGDAVAAQRGDAVGSPAEPPGAQPGPGGQGVRVTYEAALATISTGDRRAMPVPPGSALIQMGRETAGVSCMLNPGDPGR
jgi:hypothetical protein